MSEVNNFSVMLLVYAARCFHLTYQDGRVALPPESRLPSVGPKLSCALVLINTAAEQNEITTEVQEIVTFEDGSTVDKKAFPVYVNIGSPLKDAAISQRTHDIQNFLRRPVICHQGTWSVTHQANDILVKMPMPQGCFTASPMIREKLAGFVGFRAKMRMRVQLNCQRFQQGRLLLHWLPDTLSAERVFNANCCLGLKTQQPRIDMDAGDTDVELEVPFVNPSLYYDLVRGVNNFGTFYLSVYSPLVSPSGPTNAEFTVWCQFVDVEVVYPTIRTSVLEPQAGKFKRRAGAGPAVNPTDAELSEDNSGPISGFLTRVSTASSILGEIPLISSFAAPASWVTSVLARSAQALGFSKPTIECTTDRKTLQIFPGMNTYNQADSSQKLSFACDNKLQELPGFAGTDVDEMSIQYLVQIPSYIRTVNWPDTATEGTTLLTLMANPCYRWLPESLEEPYTMAIPGNLASAVCPPVGYIANLFRRWRGSINFTLKFVKTEFHSGRLMFVFFPGQVSPADCTYAAAEYCYKQIIDIRDATEFTVNVPYVSLQPWTDIDTLGTTSSATYSGIIKVFVINSLRAPPTVSTSTKILVEVSGGSDTQFQWPNTAVALPVLVTGLTPSAGLKAQSLDDDEGEEVNMTSNPTMQPQSGLGLKSATSSGGLSNLSGQPTIDEEARMRTIQPDAYCSGESVSSLRQLLKRFSTFITTTGGSGIRVFTIYDPFIQVLSSFRTGEVFKIRKDCGIDMISYISSMYALNRGSVRIKNNTYDDCYMEATIYRSRHETTIVDPFSTIQLPVSGGYFNQITTDNRALARSSLSGGMEIEVPAYQRNHSRKNRVLSAYTDSPNDRINGSDVSLTIRYDRALTGRNTFYRAAGDDYSCGFFVGTFPLVNQYYGPTSTF